MGETLLRGVGTAASTGEGSGAASAVDVPSPARSRPIVVVAVPAVEASSFEDWYREEWPRLTRVLTAYCGSAQLATEVAAEAFARAAERWPRSGGLRNPTAWTSSVAFNLVKARRRRVELERRFLRRTAAVASHTPAGQDVDLWQAVEDLPPRMCQAIVLRYVGDLTEAGVAEAMGVTVGQASSLLSRARERLAADPRTRSSGDLEDRDRG